MIEFRILKQSTRSRARLGILKTAHGEVETPTLVPVATQAAVKTLTSEEAARAGCRMLIANTFHLHVKPGEKIVKAAGGLHAFMNWRRPLMTDSGGFQVFSLGFGRDLGVGKVLKYFPGKRRNALAIQTHAQPKSVRITPDGVQFRSPIDGAELFIGPRESIRIQEALGADIIFAFDECTPPTATLEYIVKSLRRTHRWAKVCLEAKRGAQAIFGIVQGSRFQKLREESAEHTDRLGFDGFGIGGDLGSTKKTMDQILQWTIPHLNAQKPRHLLGIGYLEDMEMIVTRGIDLFDCTAPTHYGRRGIAFTNAGKLDLMRLSFLKDKKPLDPRCECEVCGSYRRNYISHLFRAREMGAHRLLTFHNLFFFNAFAAQLRERIKRGGL